MSKLSKISFLPNLIILIILFILPVIQIGISYYLSVSFLSFMFIFLLSFQPQELNKNHFYLLLFGSLGFIIKSAILILLDTDVREVFIPLREMLCFMGFFVISKKLSLSNFKASRLQTILLSFFIIVLIFVIIQSVYIAKGQYLGIPIDLFVVNQDQLLGAEEALNYGTRFRPTAFYGEPSYTAWISLTLLLIILIRKEFSEKIKITSIFLVLLIVTISQALSGVISIIIIVFFWLFTRKKKISPLIVISFLFILIGGSFFLLYFSDDLIFRIEAILTNSDASSNIRLSDPLVYFSEMLKNNNLLGVNNYGEINVDNAIWGLILQYGFLLFIIIIPFVRFLKSKILILYFILALNFSGVFFRFDKVLVISLLVGLTRAKIIEKEVSEHKQVKIFT